MSEKVLNSAQVNRTDEQYQKLAAAYALILSWLEPSREGDAGSENFDDDMKSAEKTSTDNADGL